MRSRSSGTTQVATTCQPASEHCVHDGCPTAPVAPVISTVCSLIRGSVADRIMSVDLRADPFVVGATKAITTQEVAR